MLIKKAFILKRTSTASKFTLNMSFKKSMTHLLCNQNLIIINHFFPIKPNVLKPNDP